jgi:hypothetical protein
VHLQILGAHRTLKNNLFCNLVHGKTGPLTIYVTHRINTVVHLQFGIGGNFTNSLVVFLVVSPVLETKEVLSVGCVKRIHR